MGEIIVRVIDMPEAVGAVTVVDENGDYNIYLNARRGDLVREYMHELKHIQNNDFYNDVPICTAEMGAR